MCMKAAAWQASTPGAETQTTDYAIDAPLAAFTPEEAQRSLCARPDGELVRLVAEGEAGALEELYDRYFGKCYSLALRLLSNRMLAEEVVQEAFLVIWCRPESYDCRRGQFAPWLLSVVHHSCVDELRKAPIFVAFFEGDLAQSGAESGDAPGYAGRANSNGRDITALSTGGSDPLDELCLQEQQQLVRLALEQLSAPQRQVLELSYFNDMSQTQIATRLEQPLGTIKTRTRLGLQHLRSMLAAGGLLASEAQDRPAANEPSMPMLTPTPDDTAF